MDSFGIASTVFLILTLALWWFRGRVGGSHPFWRLAAARPNEAYDWFVSDPAWVLEEGRAKAEVENRRLLGPYRLSIPKLNWKTVLIFGDEAMLEESQERFVAEIGKDWRAPRPKFALLFLLWPIGNMWFLAKSSEGAEGVLSLLGFGFSHLGYLMLAAGLFLGRFGVFGLSSRGATFLSGLAVLVLGFVLVNL